MKRFSLALLACVAVLCTRSEAQKRKNELGLEHATFIVKLLSPISTKTSSEGDMFTALVEEPSAYKDAVVEGKITKLKKPKKGVGKGKSEIAFRFESLTVNGRTIPVDVELKDVANSKGVKAVDEEGQVIGKSSNKKRIAAAAAGAGIGALLGALAGGADGAATGSMVGLGAGIAIGLTMTTTGSELEFLPGSTFTLDVSDRARRMQ